MFELDYVYNSLKIQRLEIIQIAPKLSLLCT